MGAGDQHIRSIQALLKYRNGLSVPKKNCPPDIQRSATFMHEHLFEEGLSTEKVKVECCIYYKSFSAKFKIWMGQYPQEYFIHHRIEASKLLLLKSDLTITAIGLLVGFSSLSAYCNTFKRKSGMKPSKWRRENRGGIIIIPEHIRKNKYKDKLKGDYKVTNISIIYHMQT